jgi:hypothetical protein
MSEQVKKPTEAGTKLSEPTVKNLELRENQWKSPMSITYTPWSLLLVLRELHPSRLTHSSTASNTALSPLTSNGHSSTDSQRALSPLTDSFRPSSGSATALSRLEWPISRRIFHSLIALLAARLCWFRAWLTLRSRRWRCSSGAPDSLRTTRKIALCFIR